MKTNAFLKTAIIPIILALVLMSCEKEKQGGLTLKFSGTTPTSGLAIKSSNADAVVVIESFKINIGEIELEFHDDQFISDSIGWDDEIELKGPFEIDLIKNGDGMVTTILSNVELPPAGYEEIEFEFKKSRNSISEMYQKTVLVKGTINGVPFVYWTDEEFEVEIEFDDEVYVDEATLAVVNVSFNIASLFDPAQGGINIANATDGNGNGIIEIFEDDPDGNEDLAERIEDRLDDIIEAFEDQYDD
ncbi:MAG: hypothetical protein K0B09_06385 [Bacteroidales bacterium]|nr:hypothetical protein [Bacteroidales bacterium]